MSRNTSRAGSAQGAPGQVDSAQADPGQADLTQAEPGQVEPGQAEPAQDLAAARPSTVQGAHGAHGAHGARDARDTRDTRGVHGLRGVRPSGYGVLRPASLSFLVHRRSVVVALVLAVLLAVAVVLSLCVGESFVPPDRVVRVLLGSPGPDQLVVGTLRLPRLVVGLLSGAAFGLAGALIQTVARNPLASPDVIGVTHGAGAATVAAISFNLVAYDQLPYASVAGGLAATLLVYVFAWRRGLNASRFVLVGIAVSVALSSLIQLLLTKGDVLVAQQAKVWLTGSLNSRGYDQARPLALVLLLAVPAVLWAVRAQRVVSFDDHTATALGVRLNRARVGLTALGVVLASVATGATGPIGFVALLAPQLARRLTRATQIPLLSSALTGSLVVIVADLLARRLFSPVELPVGVLTAVVGAPYLMWLISRSRDRNQSRNRSNRGRSGGTS